MAYGYAFGLVSTESRSETRTDIGREAIRGVLVGTLVWLVNFQLFARNLYPWLFATQPIVQLLLHAFAFGAVLGVLFARRERRRVKKEGTP